MPWSEVLLGMVAVLAAMVLGIAQAGVFLSHDWLYGLFSKLWALSLFVYRLNTAPNICGYQNGTLMLGTTHMIFGMSTILV